MYLCVIDNGGIQLSGTPKLDFPDINFSLNSFFPYFSPMPQLVLVWLWLWLWFWLKLEFPFIFGYPNHTRISFICLLSPFCKGFLKIFDSGLKVKFDVSDFFFPKFHLQIDDFSHKLSSRRFFRFDSFWLFYFAGRKTLFDVNSTR